MPYSNSSFKDKIWMGIKRHNKKLWVNLEAQQESHLTFTLQAKKKKKENGLKIEGFGSSHVFLSPVASPVQF
jgi:hypothetical protein